MHDHLVDRSQLDERLDGEIGRAVQTRGNVSLLMIRVDRFERLSEEHGRLAADHALRAVAARIASLTGQQDVVALWGGAELAMLAVGADFGDASLLAGRVHRAVEGLRLFVTRGRVFVTVSIGVASHDEVLRADGGAAALVALASERMAGARVPGA